MLKSGYTPTATTYTALISSYGKAGDLDSALDIFKLMVCILSACLRQTWAKHCSQDWS